MQIKSALILSLLIFLPLVVSAQERRAQNVIAELQAAANSTVSAYKQGGMTGLIVQSKACYEQTDKPRFQCIYLDFAARRLGEIAGEGKRFPLTEYFTDLEFMPRAAEILIAANMEKDQANRYLLSVRKAMDQATDKAIETSLAANGRSATAPAMLEVEQVRQISAETYRAFRTGSYSSVLSREKQCWTAAKRSAGKQAALTCGTRMSAGGLIDQAYSRQEMRGSMPGFGPTEQRTRFQTETRKLGLSQIESDEALQQVVGGIQEILAGLMQAGMR
jgi:hypothetical protein